MKPDWAVLDRELERWAKADLTLPLWWRDDDAIDATHALDRLLDLAVRIGLPVHLAVIPAGAKHSLAGLSGDHMIPVVHGWAHENHAPRAEKKAEFGAHRATAEMRIEAARGLIRLSGVFGGALAPMFVPPWNRVAPDLVAELPGAGYRMLSTFTPRNGREAVPGLAVINTHLDPIDWRAGKVLRDPDVLIAQAARQLADRREGRADASEPYGILTHHLVHDEAIWSFAETLLTRLLAGPVERWTARGKGAPDEPT